MDAEVETWADILRLEVLDGWTRWASFGCVWLWCCLFTRTTVLTVPIIAYDANVFPGFLALVGTVISLFVIVVSSKRISSVLDSRRAIALATGLFVVSSLLIIVGCGNGGTILAVIGGICGGLSIGILKIAWGEMYSRLPLSRGLISMGLALVSSIVAYFILLLAPVEIVDVALVASGTACGPLLFVGGRKLVNEPQSAGIQVDQHAQRLKMSWKFLVLPILVALTYGVVGMEFAPVIQSYDSFLSCSLSEAICGLVLLGFSRLIGRRFGAAQIYGFGLIFVVLGYLMLSFEIQPSWLAFAVHNFGFSMFYFFMVVFWGNLASRMDSSVVRVYAIGYFCFMSVYLAGALLDRFLLKAFFPGSNLMVPIAIIFAFFIAILFLFGDSRSPVHIWLTGEEPAEVDDRVSDACARIADAHHLTAREYEVLIILARGRNASFVSNSLGIAYDTAKVHIKNIYNKLDVHNQQELLDRVDEQLTR